MPEDRRITVALAGNANVGKSVIFNQLTGLNQIVGNWPGKTVEKAEGSLYFEGHKIHIIDLPGIYSLSAYSIEELVARDYIIKEKPDVVINVLDASALERNLYFTIQLIELEVPIVIALNQVDFAAKKGIRIDEKKLSKSLGIPVIPTVAVTGLGLKELLSAVLKVVEGKDAVKPLQVTYGKEIEERISKLQKAVLDLLPEASAKYPPRWLAVKLLERDPEIVKQLKGSEKGRMVVEIADGLAKEIEGLHGEPSVVIIASERYGIASRLASEAQRFFAPPRLTIGERMDSITAHKFLGYPFLAGVMTLTFLTIFILGGILIGYLEALFDDFLIPLFMGFIAPLVPPWLGRIVKEGILSGIAAGVTIALPYVVPFYLILAILEDTGYLPRAAFLMDNLMHKIGLHGKAFIPLLLGYGCNVPACIGCRIMETERERLLAAFVTVLIPCAARTVVILGLVGEFVGLHAALGLYAFDLIIVFILGRIAFKALPGEPIGLIMEMPPYKVPSSKVVLKKTWFRTKEFVYVAFPLIVFGSTILSTLETMGLMESLAEAMRPLIVGWLGLPATAGIPLIFGILRKELTLILLAQLIGTTKFSTVLTSRQMVIFSMVTMIYIPCIATIAALIKEFGWKRAFGISLLDVTLALFMGGLANFILQAWPIV